MHARHASSRIPLHAHHADSRYTINLRVLIGYGQLSGTLLAVRGGGDDCMLPPLPPMPDLPLLVPQTSAVSTLPSRLTVRCADQPVYLWYCSRRMHMPLIQRTDAVGVASAACVHAYHALATCLRPDACVLLLLLLLSPCTDFHLWHAAVRTCMTCGRDDRIVCMDYM